MNWYKEANTRHFIRLKPSDTSGLYKLSVSNFEQPWGGGQILKTNLSLDEAQSLGQEWAKKWGYEYVEDEKSSNQYYNDWLNNHKKAQSELNISPNNPLNGKSPAQVRRILNNNIIPHEQIKGFFSDEAWEGIHQIWTAFDNSGIDWGITGSEYQHYDGVPSGKKWQIEVNYFDKNNKPKSIYGTVIASGAGTVEDPLSRYDIVVYF